MTRTLDSALTTAAAASHQAKEYLVAIADWPSGTTVRWNLTGVDLEYPTGSGTIYAGRFGAFGKLTYGGDENSVDLLIDNADYAVRRRIAANDPRGCAVTVTEVWVDPDDRSILGGRTLTDSRVIGAIRYPKPNVAFGLRPARRPRAPSPPVLWAPGCPHTYRGTEPASFSCQYDGPLLTCARTWDACVQHNNHLNYGGTDMVSAKEG